MQQDPGRTSLQRARSARARLRRPPPAAAAGDAPAVWDVVVYVEPPSAAPGGARRVRLGLVAETKGAMVMVEPLVVDADAAGGGGGDYAAGGVWWTHDEAAALDGPQAVALGEVLRVVEADYSQRQDKVGPGNPHGEHAHDVFLPLVPLAPEVFTGLED